MSSTAAAAAAGASASAAAARDFLSFVDASPSAYHAVAECSRRLEARGFTRLSERELWQPVPGGLYYTTRNQSAIVAFAVGGAYAPGAGFTIAAAHTDSPCLRVKPVSALKRAGYLSVGVETYGGGLWYSWLDRDLSVAGRAVVAVASAAAEAGGARFDSRLVRIARPILRIPSLAIHLNREVNSEGLKLNAENHLAPVLASAVRDALASSGGPAEAAAAAAAGGAGSAPPPSSSSAAAASSAGALSRHHSSLVTALAAELGVAPGDVLDFDLCLYDTQPAAIGGLHDEFILSARLDNLMMTYTALQGLIDSAAAAASPLAPALAADTNVRVMAAFDHEEVGSASVPGAASTLLEDVIRRLCPDPALQPIALRKSILISADMAHAVHPNHAHLHEENHRPAMHGGLVVKCNANQRYATTNVTAFLMRRMAEEAGVPVQAFVVRQDAGCGSTIGPIVATRAGLRTVDVGIPQLAMHSCREMCGVDDAAHAVRFFTYMYARFAGLDAAVEHAD